MEDQDLWDSDSESFIFEKDRHILYLDMMYQLLPAPYQGQEINRLTLAYFVISGLDILGALDRVSSFPNYNFAHPLLQFKLLFDENARIIVLICGFKWFVFRNVGID